MSSMKATYLLQQENKIYYGWLSWALPHSDLNQVPQLKFEYRTCYISNRLEFRKYTFCYLEKGCSQIL